MNHRVRRARGFDCCSDAGGYCCCGVSVHDLTLNPVCICDRIAAVVIAVFFDWSPFLFSAMISLCTIFVIWSVLMLVLPTTAVAAWMSSALTMAMMRASDLSFFSCLNFFFCCSDDFFFRCLSH